MSHIPQLPDFPWDTLASNIALAHSHPDGVCDLSVGTPVDPTPAVIQRALSHASDAAGYPTVWGTPRLRQSIIDYVRRRWSAPEQVEDACVLPVIGTKELVGWLPTLLGLGSDDTVVIPDVAYPTYEVGALMARARVVRASSPDQVESIQPGLVWINSPSNPTGAVMTTDQLAAWVDYARARGAILAADECYGEFGWQADPVSVLDPRVNGGVLDGLVAAYSLSKRSNLAGYRAGFVVGDPSVVQGLLGLRKHLGMMVSTPVQAAMCAALDDQVHVEEQRRRYLRRRAVLSTALLAQGFRVDDSQAGLYLWATRGEPGRVTAQWLAGHGIIVAPGDFYGPSGVDHVRIALTATDHAISEVRRRLSERQTDI
ncbi:MAG: succinyldiaminopimelate transaminase [Propionibacteriaceae bacterium]|jgi:succinyldiaminopimelate transaminase|nr:succinyldiaminopimelate transaminase [Propionibacteriaceae bacterium]